MSNKRYRKSNRNKREVVIDATSPLFDSFDEYSTCKSKNAYDSEWQAQFVVDETEKKSGKILDFYQCPYCNKWHLTENY